MPKMVEEMTMMDDQMMRVVFQGKEGERTMSKIVSIILGRNVEIKNIHEQENLKILDPLSKCVVLDAIGYEGKQKVFDVEMQKYSQSDLSLRARFYGSYIDVTSLKEGDRYIQLPDRYVIFICVHDPFKEGKVLYHFMNKDGNLSMEDNTHFYFVNVSGNDCTSNELQSLIHDLNCPVTEDLTIEELRSRMRVIKKENEGKTMIEFINEHDPQYIKGKEKGIELGTEKGIEIRNKEIAKNLLNSGFSDDMILSVTGLTRAELDSLKTETRSK